MDPAVGAMSCNSPLPTVVLPQPDSPTRASVRPAPIANETPSTARTCPIVRRNNPRRIGKCTFRSRTSSNAPLCAAGNAAAAAPASGRKGGTAPSSSRWHLAKCGWSAPPGTACQAGTSVSQRACTKVQRGAKRHPMNCIVRGGTMPGIVVRDAPRLAAPGSAANRRVAYGCKGRAKNDSRLPISMISPAYISATRWAMRATTPRSWVMSRIAMPLVRWSSASRSRICACMVTSSAVVGSSAINTSGSEHSARAIMTRCFIPPESWNG